MCLPVVVICGGCQTLHPFRESVHHKTAVLREWTHSGLDAMQSGRLAQARSLLTRAARQSPNDALARVNLARADARLGNLTEAIDHMRVAIELSPDEAGLQVETGELHFKAGHNTQAVHHANKALAINPRSAGAWALLGMSSQAAGNYGQALTQYQRSLSYSTQTGRSNDKVQMRMAQVYQQLGKPTRALSTVEQLLSRYPRDRQPEAALMAKGEALMKLDQWDPACDVLVAVCERPDAPAEAFIRLSEAQLSNGQSSLAQRTLALARTRHPDLPLGQLKDQFRVAAQAATAGTLHDENMIVR